jgi:hypothetical protein
MTIVDAQPDWALEVCDLDASMLWRIHQGEIPRADILFGLAGAYGVKVADLVEELRHDVTKWHVDRHRIQPGPGLSQV